MARTAPWVCACPRPAPGCAGARPARWWGRRRGRPAAGVSSTSSQSCSSRWSRDSTASRPDRTPTGTAGQPGAQPLQPSGAGSGRSRAVASPDLRRPGRGALGASRAQRGVPRLARVVADARDVVGRPRRGGVVGDGGERAAQRPPQARRPGHEHGDPDGLLGRAPADACIRRPAARSRRTAPGPDRTSSGATDRALSRPGTGSRGCRRSSHEPAHNRSRASRQRAAPEQATRSPVGLAGELTSDRPGRSRPVSHRDDGEHGPPSCSRAAGSRGLGARAAAG